MKKLITLLLLIQSVCVFSQEQDSLGWRYADVSYPLGGFSSKAKVTVDYGETVTGWFRKADMIDNEDGKAIKFKSPVDALNWMSVHGWELVQSYQAPDPTTAFNPLTYQHFIMRRKEPYSVGK